MPDAAFLALAHQCGLTGSSRGLKIPPELRVRLGLPARSNKPLKVLEAATREGLILAAGETLDLRALSAQVGVALSSLQDWRRDLSEYDTIRTAAREAEYGGEDLLVFAGRLRIWPPDSPGNPANTGDRPGIPVRPNPAQFEGEPGTYRPRATASAAA